MSTFSFNYSGLDEIWRDINDETKYTLRVSKTDEADAREMVLRELLGAFVSGSLSAGDELPSESELADTFRVTRSSVREAFLCLRALGLVEVEQPVALPTADRDTISRNLAVGLWIIVGALLTYGIIVTAIKASALFTG